MKTCPNPKCKTTGIPDEAKFCPNCGTPLNSTNRRNKFLYGEEGRISSIKGRLLVDIRQCTRISGLGWDGKYEFSPGLPTGFTGFYAMFDKKEDIQALIIEGKLSFLFLVSGQYTLTIWSEEKRNADKEIDEDKNTTYFAFRKDDDFIMVGSNEYKEAERSLLPIMDKCNTTYANEFNKLFGVPWKLLIEDAKEFSDNDDQNKNSIQ